MKINTSDNLTRENYIANTIVSLLNNGISSSEILVLTLNGFKKEKLITNIQNKIFTNKSIGIASLNICTFQGLIRNSLLKNWPIVENILSKNFKNTEIIPELSGLDASQYLLKNIIEQSDFEDYFSKKNLMHQLLRRYKLIVENALSKEEILSKTKILNETFSNNASLALHYYKALSSKYRQFDNIKQTSTFMYLFKNNLINDFEKINYFFVDDFDEMNYIAFEFCYEMLKKTNSYVCLDKDGSSRIGYLCAYKNAFERITKDFKYEIIENKFATKLANDAYLLAENIKSNKQNKLENFELLNYSKRLEMLNGVYEQVQTLLKKGIHLKDIIIVAPDIDKNLYYVIKSMFSDIKLQLLTGNKKVLDDNYVCAILTIIALMHTDANIYINSFDIRNLLNITLKIPLFECKDILNYFEKSKKLPNITIEKYPVYTILREIIDDETLKTKTLFEKFSIIFMQIIAPNLDTNYDFDCINLFGKSINEFESLQKKLKKDGIQLKLEDWYYHLKSSVVSQTPSNPANIQDNSILFTTPQKLIDLSIQSKYQIWLDCSSQDWIKEDTGTIYNSWVFQKDYEYKEFSTELNKKFTIEKTSSLLRKLTLLACEKIFCFSSTYNSSGTQNTGELAGFIKVIQNKQIKFKFIPRDDQKEIIKYKKGIMAVPAVPGAGKTTVMLALLLELVKRGVDPKKIVVLTYMDSAANNFLTRYKNITGNFQNLPSISTIHSFAYRLLSENNNYTKVNLESSFSVCDDSIRSKIIEDITIKSLPKVQDIKQEAELYQKGISKVKTRQVNMKNYIPDDEIMKNFSIIYNEYSYKLRELNLIDYDDLLVLAIKLLKENSDILNYYQNKFEYIIEDEAQDSSKIQQELLSLLSNKHKNLIRCGDVNQAITGTFSEADVEGFKNFIKSNLSFSMTISQRCNKKIYELANNLIDYSKLSKITENAFFDLKMQGIDGKNPIFNKPLTLKITENRNTAMQDVIVDIKQKLSASDINNKPTFAILLRSNKAVFEWSAFLERNGLDVICMTDSISQKKVFKFILASLKFFVEPFSNNNAANLYKEFSNIGTHQFNKELFEKIKNEKTLFISPEFLKRLNSDIMNSLWWDIVTIIEDTTISFQELVIKLSNNYLTDIIDKSNAYIFAMLIERYLKITDSDEKLELNKSQKVIKYFKELLSKNSLKGINIFSKENSTNDLAGFVQIMTIHKSKGAEFDHVYLPEFTSKNFNMDFVNLCKKYENKSNSLLKKIDVLSKKKRSPSLLAKEEIEETLRLIYVAITRAKKSLYITSSKKDKSKLTDFLETFINKE